MFKEQRFPFRGWGRSSRGENVCIMMTKKQEARVFCLWSNKAKLLSSDIMQAAW